MKKRNSASQKSLEGGNLGLPEAQHRVIKRDRHSRKEQGLEAKGPSISRFALTQHWLLQVFTRGCVQTCPHDPLGLMVLKLPTDVP